MKICHSKVLSSMAPLSTTIPVWRCYTSCWVILTLSRAIRVCVFSFGGFTVSIRMYLTEHYRLHLHICSRFTHSWIIRVHLCALFFLAVCSCSLVFRRWAPFYPSPLKWPSRVPSTSRSLEIGNSNFSHHLTEERKRDGKENRVKHLKDRKIRQSLWLHHR